MFTIHGSSAWGETSATVHIMVTSIFQFECSHRIDTLAEGLLAEYSQIVTTMYVCFFNKFNNGMLFPFLFILRNAQQ